MADAKADNDGKLDKILEHLDSTAKRLDAMEASMMDSSKKADAACAKLDAWDKEKKDAAEKEEKEKADAATRKDAEDKEEKAKADAAKKDAEEKAMKDAADKEEQEKKDAAKADAASKTINADALAKIAELERHIRPTELSAEDKARCAEVQMRADSAFQAWGDQAPPVMRGESVNDFRLRLLSKIKQHSKVYKDSNLAAFTADESAFGVIEKTIINDAIEASRGSVTAGAPLQKRVTRMDSGHVVTKWIGDPNVAWGPFMGGATKFGRINIDMANKSR